MRPQRTGSEQSARRRTLLSLILEGTANGLKEGIDGISRWVQEVHVLATGLTDDAWQGAIQGKIVGDLLPECTKDLSAAGEVQTGKVIVIEGNLRNALFYLADELWIRGNKLDDSGW